MRLKSKVTLFLSLCLLLCLLWPQRALAAELPCSDYQGDNISSQNYTVRASTVKSALAVLEDGGLMRFQGDALSEGYLVEYYDQNYNRTAVKEIAAELPIYGAFYYDGSFYYVLSGQSNTGEDDTVEVFRLTKYDSNWNRIGEASLYGANTYYPFNAGSARIIHEGKNLFIRTCHTMYATSDGLHHQANVTLQIDTEQMQVVDGFYGIMNISYGYCSHSFNQYIQLKDGHIVGVDHGDAYPRAIVLAQYRNAYADTGFSKSCDAVSMLDISGETGANATGVSVGGFEITADHYVVAGNSVEMGDSYTAGGIRNIFVSAVDSSLADENAAITFITSYTDRSPSTPQLVKVNDDKLLLLWEYDGSVNYCTLDSAGNVTSEIFTMVGALSDCKPVIREDKAIWYVWQDGDLDFYEVDVNEPSLSELTEVHTGHEFDVTYANENDRNVYRTCRKCGYSDSFTTLEYFTVFGRLDSSASYSYSTGFPRSVNEGDAMGFLYRYSDGDNQDLSISSSDESVVKVINDSYISFVGAGTAEVTIYATYRPSLKMVVTYQVSHVMGEPVVTQEATCVAPRITKTTCDVCGYISIETGAKDPDNHVGGTLLVNNKENSCGADGYTGDTICCSCDAVLQTGEIIPATGEHTRVILAAIPASCTDSGLTEGESCSVCGKVFTERTEVPALGHDYQLISSVQDSCDVVGKKTYSCSRCDDGYTEDIPVKAHIWTLIETKEATCTQAGYQKYSCSACSKIKISDIPEIGHSYHYEVTPPTCTEQGYTTITCEKGDYESVGSYINATGHVWTVVGTERSSCDEEGTAYYICSVCQEQKTETLAAGEHTWTEEVTKEAGCLEAGEKTYTCSVCGLTEKEEIPAVGHIEGSLKIENRVEPDVFNEGSYDEVCSCSVCGEEVSRVKKSIPRLSSAEISDTEILLAEETCIFTGEECLPEVVVTYKGVVLTEGVHYTLYYSDNVRPGQATVSISGTGLFEGVLSRKFTIVKEYQQTRLAGATRYATALESADALKELLGVEQFDSVVIASAINFPDALAGSPLASQLDAPILLVGSNEANKGQAEGTALTLDYIRKNLKEKGRVYILGGSSAVPESTETALAECGFTVTRLAGANRYATNMAIINEMEIEEGTDIVIVRGYTSYKTAEDSRKKTNPQGYADSLSVSGVAGYYGMPIFLADKAGLNQEQIAKIKEINPTHIYVIGGNAAVSDEAYSQIKGISSGLVERLAGSNRYETSVEIARRFGMDQSSAAVIAYGQNFPDGLTGGVLAAKLGAPLLLTENNRTSVQEEFLADSNITSLYILGGTAVLPDTTICDLIQ